MLRHSYRINVDYEAELKLGDNIYTGIIENLSENGMSMRLNPVSGVDFPPGLNINVGFESPEGGKLFLGCRIIWSQKNLFEGAAGSLGLEIVEVPLEYEEFFKTLYCDHMRIM